MPPLPFRERADLVEQGGAVVVGVALSAWPLPDARVTPAGATYDWIGEAELGVAGEVIGKANRTFVFADGRRLKLVGSARHEILPHVELRLREMRPGG